METMHSTVSSSSRVAGGFRKLAARAFAPARSPHSVAELDKLIQSFDARFERAKREIDALLEYQASKRQ